MSFEQEPTWPPDPIADSAPGDSAQPPKVQERAESPASGLAGKRLTRLAGSRALGVYFAMLLILGLGAYFRFTGLNWDDTYHLHPDERFLTSVAASLSSADPLTYLKTSESPLNPYNIGQTFYVYGNFPMTATRLIAEWVDAVASSPLLDMGRRFIYYDGIHLVGRALSGLVDLVSVLFTFLIGRKLYNAKVGLLGALLMAAAVMPIQQSHFFTMDNWAAGLTSFALYAAVRASENARAVRWWLLFGFGYGLAVASRINMAPLAAMAGVAAFVWLARQAQDPNRGFRWRSMRSGRSFDLIVTAFVGVAIAGLASIVVFRLAQPYAFADAAVARSAILDETGREAGPLETAIRSVVSFNPQWRSNLDEISRLQSPDASFPPALQWTSRAPLLFPLVNFVLWGVGLPAGLAALFGFLWALWQTTNGRPQWTSHLFLVAWAGGYFAFMGTRWVTSIRYFLPIYPALLLLAAWALIELWSKAARRSAARLVAGGLAALVTIATILWANAFLDIYRQPVTRVAASAWMLENIPTGATLVYEADGEQKEIQLPVRQFTLLEGGSPLSINFRLPEDGLLLGLRFNYLFDADLTTDSGESLRALLLETANGRVLAESGVNLQLVAEREQTTLSFSEQALASERNYSFLVEAGPGGPIQVDTSVITSDHWDDALPVRYEGIDPYSSYYRGLSDGAMPITIPDSETKRQDLYRWLNEADYIVLSSQRALWSLPRIPLTFPLTMAYYEALFDEALGFELVAQFHRTLAIGPLHISDVGGRVAIQDSIEPAWPPPGWAAAEEAFSVYDHPPVWIFAKTDAYSPSKVRQVLGDVNVDNVVVMTPGEASRAPGGLLLDRDTAGVQQAGGTFADVFDAAGLLNRTPWLAALVWWLAALVLGWLAVPLAFVAFPGLADRGYPLARVLTLLLVSFLAWLAASLRLLPFSRGTLVLALVVVAALSLFFALRNRAALVQFLRRNLGLILLIELLGLGLYLLFIGIRMGNPDIWDVIWGGEKPMDLSYFNAVLKSTYFPPYDPWFAGGYINYYYYGFVLVGSLTKLLGILPTVAYNLILPSLFSLTGLGVFSGAYNLLARRSSTRAATDNGRSWRLSLERRAVTGGLAALALAVLVGNLAEVSVVLNAWYRAGDTTLASGFGALDTIVRTADGALDLAFTDEVAPIYTGDWFWTATRAIHVSPGEVQPITEFPFFTFLYGDLHAHMIALPLTLLALAWAISTGLRPVQEKSPGGKEGRVDAAWLWFVGAAAIGVLRVTNTWDFPTYLLIGMAAVFLYNYRRSGRLDGSAIGRALFQAGLLTTLAVLLFLPFALNYGVGYASFSLWSGSYTGIRDYLLVHGLPLFLAGTYLIMEFRRWSFSWSQGTLFSWRRFAWPLLAALFAAVFLMAFFLRQGYLIGPLALSIALLAGLLALRPGLAHIQRVPLFLAALAVALTLMVEIIVLDGDIGRMNTVFKFYLQVWILLSVVGGVAFANAQGLRASRTRSARLWRLALGVLVAAAALYPLLATGAKWAVRMSDEAPITLDGMAFMQTTSYGDTAADGTSQTIHLGHDYEAIRWIWANIPGSPVIAEAHGFNPYRSVVSRVAMYTGLPTIVGWDWHQRQQRAVLPGWLVTTRTNDVNRLYNTTDVAEALDILRAYDVRYVYAGQLEWVYYNPQGLLKFEQMAEQGLLKEIYRNSGVSIYEVLGS